MCVSSRCLAVNREKTTAWVRRRAPKKRQRERAGDACVPGFPFPTAARSPADADAAPPIHYQHESSVGVHSLKQSSWRERSTGRRARGGGGARGGKDAR